MDDPALLVQDIAEVTPQWLSDLLRTQCGIDTKIGHLAVSQVGSGQIGVSYRLVPEYCEAPEGAPRSLVIKIAAGSEDMRALMAPGFAWEIGFYQQLAHRLAIPPRTAGTRPSAPTSAATHW